MRFTTVVEQSGKTATGLPVPEDVVLGLGAGKRVAVRVTVGGHTYRTTVGPYRGQYLIPLSAEHRSAAGVAAGEQVVVDLELDDAPREVAVPDDLTRALRGDREARAFFDGLSYSHRKAYVDWIEEAKKAETRERRVAKALEMLHDKQKR